MTKMFRKLFLTATLLALITGAAHAQGRVATVNLAEIFKSYYMTDEARQAIVETEKELKNELKAMEEAHQKLIASYKKLVEDSNDQGVSDDERKKRKAALDPKKKELQDSETALKETFARSDADLKQKTARMMDKILGDIKKAIESKAKSGGYAFVIDSSAKASNQTELLLYNSGENDLTKSVVDMLNAAAPLDSKKK